MELVGRPAEINPVEDGKIEVLFHCCNQEVFNLFIPPAISEDFDCGKIYRIWAHHLENDDGLLTGELVIEHWESLE